MVGKTRTQISSKEMTLYSSVPANYEVIALVEASDDTGWTAAGSEDNALNKLKDQGLVCLWEVKVTGPGFLQKYFKDILVSLSVVITNIKKGLFT